MGTKTRKNTSGAVNAYISRKSSMRYLQVTLPIFNRLILWKGINPKIPKSIKKLGKGDSTERIYFHKKDIVKLSNEPLLQKLRDVRTHRLKVKKAKARKDNEKLKRLNDCKPGYSLDHLVRERFPTFESSLICIGRRISEILIVSNLPVSNTVPLWMVKKCKQLRYEWLNFIIATRAVTKVFISQCSYYIEVNLFGVNQTFIHTHNQTSINVPTGIDIRFVCSKVEFSLYMMSNFMKEAYKQSGLVYPIKLDLEEDKIFEINENLMIRRLSIPVKSLDDKFDKEKEEVDELLECKKDIVEDQNDDEIKSMLIKTLFRGKKVFLNREIPRDIFVTLIRSCGGLVSWNGAPDAPFPETDEDIEYHVIDRNNELSLKKNYGVNRCYIQPQYIADSINACRLLNARDYAPGKTLIGHISPFESDDKYVPLEKKYLEGKINKELLYEVNESEDENVDENEEIEESENEEDIADFESDENEEKDEKISTKTESIPVKPVKNNKRKDFPKEGKMTKDERATLEPFIPKKRRRLYNKMVHKENKVVKDAQFLKNKRVEAMKNRKEELKSKKKIN